MIIKFFSTLIILIIRSNYVFSIQCCTDYDCLKTDICSSEHSHCILIGRLNSSVAESSRINLSTIKITNLSCWFWLHEVEFCPKLDNECYSVHNHSDIRTFCCAGNLCNRPRNLTCEMKATKSIKWDPNNITIPFQNNTQPVVTDDFYKYSIILFVIFITVSVLVGVLWNRLNGVCARCAICKLINKSFSAASSSSVHSNYNGISYTSDRNTCLSKITGDGLSEYYISSLLEEVNKASSFYRKCDKKCMGKFGEIWTGQSVKPASGITIAANPPNLPDIVAIKIFKPSNETSWKTELEMYRYIRNRCNRILKYIGCDKVMSTDVGTNGSNSIQELWLVTEYMDCGSLYDRLSSNTGHQHPRWPEMLRTCLDIAGGLSYLHEDGTYHHQSTAPHLYEKPSIAHRDLKSRNVLIRSDWSACIADLGLAVSFHGNRSLSDLHLQVGTQRYMAPEILEGAISFSRDAYVAIDIYAMALVMWEIFSQCVDVDILAPTVEQVPVYQQPFEQELGNQITIERLQSWVVNDNKRPQFPNQFNGFEPGLSLWKTIVECWDRDAEARLSSSCVYERLLALVEKTCPDTMSQVNASCDSNTERIIFHTNNNNTSTISKVNVNNTNNITNLPQDNEPLLFT